MKSQNEKTKKLLRGVFIIGIGTFFSKLLSFIMTPFYTNWLPPEEFGNYDLMATYVTLTVPFMTLQLDQAVFRFSVEKHKYASYYFKQALKSTLISFVILGGPIYYLFKRTTVQGFVFSFLAYVFSFSIYLLCSEYLRGTERLKEYSICNILVGILIVALSFLLVKQMQLGAIGMLLVYALAYGIIVVFFCVTNKLWKDKEKDKDVTLIEMMRYSIPLIPNNISWWITNVSDRTLIYMIAGEYYNGLYAISCKVPTMLSLLFSVFNISFQQVAIQSQYDDDRNSYYKKLFNQIIKLLFAGGVIIMAITPAIYILFISKAYWDSILCIPFLLCGTIFLSLGQYLGDILLAKKSTGVIGLSTILAAVVNILLNIATIERWMLIGAAGATLLAYIVLFVVRCICVKEVIDRSIIFNIAKYFLLFLGASYLILMVRENMFVICGISIVAIVFFVITNFELIRVIIKKIKGER